MTEYTSLKVSKHLAEAGFEAEPDTYWQEWPDKSLGWSIGSYDIYATTHICAYRSDTLLMWLLSLEAKEAAAKMGLRTLAENGTYGALRIQKLDSGEYVVQLYRPIEVGAQDVVLADALGLLVCTVMKEMETKP